MIRGAMIAASLGLCLAGVGTVTEGVAVPVKARTAQHGLEQVFEQRLKASRAEPRAQHRTAPRALPAPPVLPTDGPIARISVDRLGAEAVILAGTATKDRLALGPTMLKPGDAANPVTIVAAHRDTHFRFIRDLHAGDEIALESVTGEIARYRVTRLDTVRWDRFAYPLDPARPLLALVTCYPFDGTEYGGPLRRVAWAEKIA